MPSINSSFLNRNCVALSPEKEEEGRIMKHQFGTNRDQCLSYLSECINVQSASKDGRMLQHLNSMM